MIRFDAYNVISHPDAPSEFEIQSALFQSLLNLGYHVHAEVTAEAPDLDSRGARLDLVLYTPGTILIRGISCRVEVPRVIIEVKRHRTHTEGFRARKTAERAGQQYQRYARLGVPVIVCQGQSQIGSTLEQIHTLLRNPVNPVNPVEKLESQNG